LIGSNRRETKQWQSYCKNIEIPVGVLSRLERRQQILKACNVPSNTNYNRGETANNDYPIGASRTLRIRLLAVVFIVS